MRQFEQRRQNRRLIYSLPSVIILLLIFVALARSVWTVYKSSSSAVDMRIVAEKDLAELQARKTALETKMADLNTERGEEEELRGKFRVVRPGENMIVIVDNPAAANPTTTQATSTGGFFNTVTSWFER